MRIRTMPTVIGAVAVSLLSLLHAQAAGPGGAAVASLSPTRLVFAGQTVDTASAPQAVTLTNTGGAVLNIVSIAVTGADFVDFSQTNTCDNTVAVNAKCAINVTFEPQSFGTRAASLIITSSATNSPQTVSLTGMGMGPALSLSSAAVSFSGQLVTTNAQQTVRLTSSGDQPLDISSIAVIGPFSENNTCLSSVLEPGQTCSINIFFTPLAGGPATGQLTIFDNAFPPQQVVPLSGVGADFSLALTPTTNSATAGQSATYTVSVTPTGGFAGNVTLGCGGLPPGATCSFAPSTVTVNSSGAATSSVTVSTTAASHAPPGGGSRPTGFNGLGLLWLGVLLLGLSGFAVFRRSLTRLTLGFAVAAALLLAALGMPACGGAKSSSTVVSTPPDTYRLVVTGTAPAGSTSVQNTVVLTIVVM